MAVKILWAYLPNGHPTLSHYAVEGQGRVALCGRVIEDTATDICVPDGSVECKSCLKLVKGIKEATNAS